MNQEDDLGAARRSQRPRSGLAIFDEALLFELHAEMMQKEQVIKRPRSNASNRPPRPPSAQDNTPRSLPALAAAGGGDLRETSEDQRAAKRARSAASSGNGGTSADDEIEYADEDTHNVRTAWACGLTPEGLCEDEINARLLPPEANPQEYAKVRNFVLGMWRKDVSKKLTIKDVLAVMKAKDRAYALAAWQFLNAMGYINFGVAPEIQSDIDLSRDTRGTVVVVGSGCAGLSTARQLRSWGYRVIVVEGRNRPGGRVFSSRLSAPKHVGDGENSETNNDSIQAPAAVVADVGGSIITGIDGNPLAILTKQLQIPLSHIRDKAPIFMPDGTPADETLDSAVEQYYNHELMKGCNEVRAKPETVETMSLQGALEKLWAERYTKLETLLPDIKPPVLTTANGNGMHANLNYTKSSNATGSGTGAVATLPNGKPNSGKPHHSSTSTNSTSTAVPQYPLLHPTSRKARQLFEWHLANLEFANACKLDQCSLLHWDQDDPFELPGAHCFVPGCNGRWLQALTKGIPILYNQPVNEIRYCKTGVAVHTRTKVLHADAVVVTVPLGVLKRGGIAFNPPLSEHKRGAISRLGFGNLNKVILMFPKVFWSEDEDMFGHVAEDPASRGEAFLFYSYAHISGGAQLTALIAGSAAEEHEKRSAHDSVSRVMNILRSIFEPKGVVVPPPLQALITRWGSDPMAYGAYSSLPVGCKGGEDYDTMAQSVGERLFFAGEATTRRYPATMHGAFFTGLWAAADVDAALSKFKSVPQFSSTVAADVVQGITRAEEERTAAVAASLANLAALKRPSRPPSSQKTNNGNGKPPPPTTEEMAMLDKLVQEKLVLSSRLKMLFDDPDHPPDLEVGSFKAVYGAPGSHVAHQALLRIDITSARGKFSKEEREGTRQVNLYCVVLKDTAMAVAEQPDNYARVALLGSLPSVKLVERTGLGHDALSVMDSVMRWRRKQESMRVAKAGVAAAGGGAGAGDGASGSGALGAKAPGPTATNDNTYVDASALNTFPPWLPQQQQQQQQPQAPPPMFYNSHGNVPPAAPAAPAVAVGITNGWHPYQQQHQQVETRNEDNELVQMRKLEQEAAEAVAPAPPQPALEPAPEAAQPAAEPEPPAWPQSGGFSALDIALGLAVSSIDIIDLTGGD